jgi:hypothetical protein
MLLMHQESRYGEARDAALTFDRDIQLFEVDPFIKVPDSAGQPGDGATSKMSLVPI